jgi:Mlc titration factor MtfA (ptsG expression regulator)
MQEFWAESVELFFKKPALMQDQYPMVFQRMIHLLNQNPLQKESPIVKKSLIRFG